MEFALEFWRFLRHRKKYWLMPVIISLVIVGSLVVMSSGTAFAPFIYTLF